ncbi:Uncharacterized protein HZ326_14526 [Fusarium oxysporum f. sp. albedinis]|nr:Uncharacterized protein HZ326_14526 [Fusarium oxysporum f. sp. albedinis]
MTGSIQLNVIVDPQFCFRDVVCVHSSVQPKPRKAVNSSGRAVQNSPQKLGTIAFSERRPKEKQWLARFALAPFFNLNL